MNSLVEALDEVGGAMVRLSGETFASDGLRGMSDGDLLEVMSAAARVIRAGEAMVVEAATHVLDRSDVLGVDNRMTTKFGCGSVPELLQRTTRVSKRAASDIVRAARAIEQQIAPSSGEKLPADFAGMRAALGAAEVGVDGVVAVAQPLASCGAGRAAINAADQELSACARGEGSDGAPSPCADDLRAQATVWAAFLDQDGALSREALAQRKRGVTLGVCRGQLVPIRGNLLPDVAAQLQRVFDSLLNPKLDGAPVPCGPVFTDAFDPDAPLETTAELRSRAQMQHDALAAVLSITASSGALPTLGGAAPTLVVSVREADLATGTGYAHLSGCDEPISIATARHVACSGTVQRVVVAEGGRILSIGVLNRVFNHHQRRAIALRDGGCVIPGCHVPAEWCEIHHDIEHSRGGPTHTDNGVMFCWFHHRTLDTSGWQVRMNRGVPEVRGPYWWDSRGLWRPVTTSPTRMRDRMARRT